jgi:hypothetical protein
MKQTQQNALIYLSKVNFDFVKKERFNSFLGQLTPEGHNLLENYRKNLDCALKVFKSELCTLKLDEITECLETSLAKKEFDQVNSHVSPTNVAGKLEKQVNKALKVLKDDKPDYVLYPAFSRMGLIPKEEFSVVEVIEPTENPEYIDVRPEDELENCLFKIKNHHSFSKSKFLTWSKDIKEIFQGFIRVFTVVEGYSDARHILFFYKHETFYGWKDKLYTSKNGIMENHEIFGGVSPEIHCLLERLKSQNLAVVLDSLMSQDFLDNSLANNVRFALGKFNRAVENHDNCEAIVNLCSSLEAIANQLYPEDKCGQCDSKKVLAGLKTFLDTNAFRRKDLYSADIEPMEEFNAIYKLRSKIAHGSLKRSDADTLTCYMPTAFKFVAMTLYILLLNACTTGFDSKVILKANG